VNESSDPDLAVGADSEPRTGEDVGARPVNAAGAVAGDAATEAGDPTEAVEGSNGKAHALDTRDAKAEVHAHEAPDNNFEAAVGGASRGAASARAGSQVAASSKAAGGESAGTQMADGSVITHKPAERSPLVPRQATGEVSSG